MGPEGQEFSHPAPKKSGLQVRFIAYVRAKPRAQGELMKFKVLRWRFLAGTIAALLLAGMAFAQVDRASLEGTFWTRATPLSPVLLSKSPPSKPASPRSVPPTGTAITA